MRNCWTYAITHRLKYGGRIHVEWKAYGYIPRLKWQPEGSEYLEYYVAVKRIKWESLKWYQKLFPFHVLDFDGKIVKEKVNVD